MKEREGGKERKIDNFMRSPAPEFFFLRVLALAVDARAPHRAGQAPGCVWAGGVSEHLLVVRRATTAHGLRFPRFQGRAPSTPDARGT